LSISHYPLFIVLQWKMDNGEWLMDNLYGRRRMVTQRLFTLLLCLTTAAALGLNGCNSKAPAGSQTASKEASAAVPVETAKATPQTIKRVLELPAIELLPFEQTDIYAKIPGYVKEMKVDIGDRVKKDAVLAVLWVPEMEAELQQKEALIKQAEAARRQAQEALLAAQANFKSAEAMVQVAESSRLKVKAEQERFQSQYQRYLAAKNVIEQDALDEARLRLEASVAAKEEVEAKILFVKAERDESKAKMEKAGADVNAAEAHLQVAKADRDQVAALIQYTQVAAPFDGVVTKRNLHTGAFINPKSGELPLLTVVRTDRLRGVIDIPEKDARYLNVQYPQKHQVHVELDALPGEKGLDWPISRFAPVLGAGKKVRAELEIDNQSGKLYPGMYGRASVVLETKTNVLAVPAIVVKSDGKASFVYLVDNGKAKRRVVTVGLNDGNKVEITSGLDGTEEVITGSKGTIRDEQPVQIRRS
jgi:RND family efflux transporter MFP subunit